jgi:hypothetical protein
MMETVTETLELTSCPACSIQFAVPKQWLDARRENGNDFRCPNGHSLSYKSEIDRLRKALTAEQASKAALADQLQAAERSASAARGQVTKLRKRIANGVCPCCNRTFANLARHMASKHPGEGGG